MLGREGMKVFYASMSRSLLHKGLCWFNHTLFDFLFLYSSARHLGGTDDDMRKAIHWFPLRAMVQSKFLLLLVSVIFLLLLVEIQVTNLQTSLNLLGEFLLFSHSSTVLWIKSSRAEVDFKTHWEGYICIQEEPCRFKWTGTVPHDTVQYLLFLLYQTYIFIKVDVCIPLNLYCLIKPRWSSFGKGASSIGATSI